MVPRLSAGCMRRFLLHSAGELRLFFFFAQSFFFLLPLVAASSDQAGNRLPGQSLLRKPGLPGPHTEPKPWLRLCSPRPALPGETSLKASRIPLASSPCSHAQPQDKSRINESSSSSSSRAGNSWLPRQRGCTGFA